MKKYVAFVLLIIICFLSTGCWNYREINLLSIVAGMGVDLDPKTGDFILSIEIIQPSGNSREQTPTSKILESRGKTIFDGIRNVMTISGKRLFWTHAQIVIVSEDVARRGILDVIDFLYRDAEPRLTLHLVVASGASAKDIISSEGMTDKIHSLEIDNILDNTGNIEKYPLVQIFEIVEMLNFDVPYAYTASITLKKKENKTESEINGTAIFKGDKLQGFLNLEDSKYFLFVIDNIVGGLLVNKNAEGNPDANISLEIFQSKTAVKPVYSNGIISMKIQTETEVAIGESGPNVNFSNKSGLTALKKDMQEFLMQNIARVIQKVQNEFDTDIFGFGSIIYQEMPDVWKQYKDKWDAGFKELGFDISCEIKIRNTAHSGKSLKGAK
jgi:spore germination protein KC